MKRKLATNPQATTQPAVFRLGEEGTYVERTRHISDAIARRAYELFEARGFEHGHDREDWFRAESELLTPIPAKVVAINGGLTIRAKFPGFAHKDVEVHVGPKHLIIYAKQRESSEQKAGGALSATKMSDEVFRVLDLPHEIDPDKITATLENEVLEVTLQKAEPRKKIAGNVRAA
ncbi:MAG: Hsp20/alpha crystallin family protein [Candidatus Sulfotelmatobacter sp.]